MAFLAAPMSPPAAPVRKQNLFPYAWIAPGMLFIVIAILIPLVYTVYISGTNYNQRHLYDYHWIGLKNYGYAFSTDPYTGYVHGYLWLFAWTFAFAAGCTITNICTGGAIALLVNNPRLPGRVLFRAFLILPWALPFTITVVAWRGVLNTDFGAVNSILTSIGIGRPDWLNDPNLAKLCLIAVNGWFSFPYFMVLILSILQAIPGDLYEVAEIDGASAWARFRHITIPSIRPALAPLIVVQFAFQFNNAQFVFALTGGLPGTLDTSGRGDTDILTSYLFGQIRNNQAYAQMAALGVLIFIVIVFLSVFNVRITGAFKDAK
jgi:arabinogalactan oligomer / maltooligosaccharide transport system permease protein